ncbi:Hypothetical protein, putative [Bodo saltans]|uniref:Uncharacterized protein n=1 Tax=Bodo saltans TaxID=75058 RepID=A0A0S4IMR2_BODSA|nr:Hypothetical protein, putative [Bodo saltans]|eukprot:CUE73048.1 Hypothetical protein, putative [Bodo saltans]
MGVCCGKDAMPVVEDNNTSDQQQQQQQKTKRRHVPSNDAVQFDYVFDGRTNDVGAVSVRSGSALGGGGQRRSHSPGQEPLAYTPRELDATTVISNGTTNARSMGALSFITNGNQDVSYDLISRFVERMRDGTVDPLDGSILGGSFAQTTASGGRSVEILTRDQAAQIDAAPDLRRKLALLVEFEESHRVDVIAAHRMNAMLFSMASQRVVPTVRRRKSTIVTGNSSNVAAGKGGKKSKTSNNGNAKSTDAPKKTEAVPPVVVIYAQDVNIEFNNATGGEEENEEGFFDMTIHSLAGTTVDRSAASFAHSIRGSVARPPADNNGGNRLSTRDDDDGMYSPVSSAQGTRPPQQQQASQVVTPARRTDGATNHNTTSAAVAAVANSNNLQQCVEHFEMLALTAREVSITADVKGGVVTESWDFLSLPKNTGMLNNGSALYKFVSKPAHLLDPESLDMVRMFVNLSGFANETIENNAPRVDCSSTDDLSKYVVILAKAMYVLPGVRLASISKELLASLDYQRNCQAGETKFYDDITTPFTFRQSKTIIKFLFSLIIQMTVSEITDPHILNSFKDFDGIIPAKAILLERTKKNIAKQDSTAKCKSVLLYYPINDGVLVSHATIVLNTSLPGVISKVLHTFGGQGAKENAEAVRNTRRYLIHRFGDSREGLSSVL